MNKVIVVEGKSDVNKILSVFPDAYCIITNGSEININTINEIKILLKNNLVYLCLDPDGPGNKIRNIILENLKNEDSISNLINVYANQEKAISKNKRKVGIEHMSEADIKELFKFEYKLKNTNSTITYTDIYKIGLADNRVKRKEICDKMNIGYCNAKQFVKKLNMFGIDLNEVKRYL